MSDSGVRVFSAHLQEPFGDEYALARHRLLPSSDLLLEVDGTLARLSLIARPEQVRPVLEAAAFEVLEVKAYGWSEPLSLARGEVEGFAEKLPRCVVGPYRERP